MKLNIKMFMSRVGYFYVYSSIFINITVNLNFVSKVIKAKIIDSFYAAILIIILLP